MTVLLWLPALLILAALAVCVVNAAQGSLGVGTRWAVLGLVAVALLVEATAGATLATGLGGLVVQDRFTLFVALAFLAGALLGLAGWSWARGTAEVAVPVLQATLAAILAGGAGNLVVLWVAAALAAGAAVGAIHGWRQPRRLDWTALLAPGAVAVLGLGLLAVAVLARTASLRGIQGALAALPVSPGLAALMVLVFLSLAVAVVVPLGDVAAAPGDPRRPRPGPEVGVGLAVAAEVVVVLKLGAALFGAGSEWTPFVALLAAAVMLAGGAGALAATSLRSLVRALAVLQVGWLLAAAAVAYRLGLGSALTLLAAFLLAVGGMGVLSGLRPLNPPLERLAGLASMLPYRSLALALALLSLAGAPPLAGWVGETVVAVELARSGYFWLLLLGFLASLLATVAVLRLSRLMFLEPLPLDVVRGGRVGRQRATGLDVAPAVAAGLVAVYALLANPVYSLAVQAGTALWAR